MKTRTMILTIAALLAFLVSSEPSAQTVKQASMLTAQQVLDASSATQLPRGLTFAQKSALNKIAALMRENKYAEAKAAWNTFCKGYITLATSKNIPIIERWLLNQSYFKTGSKLDVLVKTWKQNSLSTKTSSDPQNTEQDPGDMSQMDMIELQEVMNKQAQLMQMMSNLQKMMNDTAMAIIRNLK